MFRAALLMLCLASCIESASDFASESHRTDLDQTSLAAASPITLSVDASAANTLTYPTGPYFDGNEWSIGPTLVPIRYPLPVITGDVITGYRVFIRKGTPYTVSAYLESANGSTGIRESMAVATSASPSGLQVAELTDLQVPVQPGTAYSIRVYGNGIAAGDVAMNASADVARR